MPTLLGSQRVGRQAGRSVLTRSLARGWTACTLHVLAARVPSPALDPRAPRATSHVGQNTNEEGEGQTECHGRVDGTPAEQSEGPGLKCLPGDWLPG
jgi:hypothetical protein